MILDFLAALLLFALLILSNTSIEGNMDFLPIYVGASSMLKNYSPYSSEGILLYLYPPWYALGTFFLGFFSLKMAATVWFTINIFLLLYSVRLIVEPMKERKIKIAQMLAILFLPILGVLVVGQFVIPVIFGLALLLSGIRTQSKAKLSFSLIFITLKPHLVILIVASVIYYYYLSSKGALYKLFIPYILPFLLTLLLSFILFPTWPVDYVGCLYQFRNTSIFSQCKNCMSLTRMISSSFNINADFLFAIGLILSLLTITRIQILEIARNEKIIVINLIVSLLISSYVRNYDYAL